MQRTVSTLLALALLAVLPSCRLDADDMNDTGYRALSFELPDEATKYFEAARELIVDETEEGADIRLHPQYPRMRRGELLVSAWQEPETALGELERTARDQPGLLDAVQWREQIHHYSLAGRFDEALAIAEWAAGAYPQDDDLARQRANLGRKLRPEDPIPSFDPRPILDSEG
ncbi:MAG: hypothetical protein ACYSWX_03335 [Planctomycetota bacterium]|jgi:tetratricopeptide (TPR) repeat protein